MRKILTSTFVLTLTLILAPAAPAGVVFTGDGSPADVGYVYQDAGSGNPVEDIFDFDTPSGILHQNAVFEDSGRWDLPTVTSELVRATGWFIEVRLETLSNAGSVGQGGTLKAGDDVGGNFWVFRPDSIAFTDDNFATLLSVPITSGFHTVRGEMAASGTVVDIRVDGDLKGSVATDPTDVNSVLWGDYSGSTAAEINWDYLVVNQNIPEPASLVLMGLGGTLLGICGWRRRKKGLRN